MKDHGIEILEPPYENSRQHWLEDPWPCEPTSVIVWRMDRRPAENLAEAFEALADRPPELDLAIVLPAAFRLGPAGEVFHRLPWLNPAAILPCSVGALDRIKLLLSLPPKDLAHAVTKYFLQTGFLTSGQAGPVQQLLSEGAHVRSVTGLARRIGTSRRTLGRRMERWALPSPSRWVQFSRLLHVCLQLQRPGVSVARAASACGYPDPFTLSNQMKRVLGLRPSEARCYLGWKWAAHAWARRNSTRSDYASAAK